MKGYKGYNKYKNEPVTIDGIHFPSQKEGARYKELSLLLKAGKIENLRLQVPYELIPKQVETTPRYHKRTGKRIKDDVKTLEQNCIYIADFVYFDKEKNAEIVEDAKGKRTKEYVIKRKLMLHVYGIRIHEV